MDKFEIANIPVSIRDLEIEKKVQADMKKYEKPIEDALDKKEKLSSDAKDAIDRVTTKMDGITEKINQVVSLQAKR